jgi:hypothetical protein
MADAPELVFLRRTLVDAGLLAPDQLDAWRLGWPGDGSFFAYLVERGVIARSDLGTLGAVYKGYLKLSAAGLLDLFKLAAPRVQAHVPGSATTAADRSEERAEAHVPASTTTGSARSAERARGGHAAARAAGPAAAVRSTPAERAAVTAAIDAALSSLPIEPSSGVPSLRSARGGLPQVGDVVAGYQLRARLGQGPRGAVYRAWAAARRRTVVVKLMPTTSQGGGLASAAARAAIHGRVGHPGVLRVLAAGEEGRLGYLVFEDPNAVGLAEWIAGQQTLTAARVAQIGAEVAGTLAAAAAVGVVHGDLKPGHLLVFGPEPRVKLSDFLAPGEAPSSRDYLAPERLHGDLAPDQRADMYSLGATLHYAVTGLAPVAATAGRGRPRIDPGLPAPLARVVARLMHAQPGARFPGWDAAAAAFLDAEPAARRALAVPEDMSHRAGEEQG